MAFELTNHGVDLELRPIRVWLAIARHRNWATTPAQVVDLLRSVLTAIQDVGHSVPSEAVWMSQDGRIELVHPWKARCDFSTSMASLGLLACEILARDELQPNISPQFALNYAKARVMAKSPVQWNSVVEYYLQRMMGLAAPFGGIQEAVRELNLICPEVPKTLGQRSMDVPEVDPGDLAIPVQIPAKKSQNWILPALAGAASVFGFLGLLIGAYSLGRLRQQPVPIVMQSQAPKVSIDMDQLARVIALVQREPANTIPAASHQTPAPPTVERPNPKVLAKLNRVSDGMLVSRSAPTAQESMEDDGPIFVPGPVPTEGAVDSKRVKDNDFVAVY